MKEEKITNVSDMKIKYPLLKKEGYKLSYGTKTKDYIDIFFTKKVDDATNLTIFINEKKVVKRFEGANYNNNIEALTCKEILAVAEIISQIC